MIGKNKSERIMNEISTRSENNKNCILCIKGTLKMTKVFGRRGVTLKIAELLCQHFWFTFNETDKSQAICAICWEKMYLFHQFYEMVREAHLHHDENRSMKDESNKNRSNKDETNDDPMDAECERHDLRQDESNENRSTKDETNDDPIDADAECEQHDWEFDNYHDSDDGDTDKEHAEIERKEPGAPTNSTEEKAKPTGVNESAAETRQKMKKIKTDPNTLDIQRHVPEYFRMNCHLCGEKLSSLNNVTSHFSKKHNLDRGYLICSCNKKAKVRKAVIEHVLWHMNPNQFRCDACSRTFNEKRTLRKHMIGHQTRAEDLLQCSLCEKRFLNQGSLTQHVLRVHPSDNQKFFCDICKKNFKLKVILEAHMKYKHSGKSQQHICDICGKVLSTKQNLKEHVNIHLDIPRLECNICGAMLKNRICLATHMKSHTDTKPICDICNEVKANWPALLNHKRRVHSKVKKHKCNYNSCEKSFTRLIALKEHVATHTGQDLYTCNYCKQTFKSNSNMYKHMKQVHPQQWTNDRKTR